ncbi:MAG: amidohydrolase family protein [Bacteroidales bacterium]
MSLYTNIHTHIFNIDCAPRRFIGIKLPQIIYNRKIVKGVTKVLKYIIPSNADILDRYANFLLIGTRKNQSLIWEDLVSAYPHLKTRFVVLSLDMDKMGAGDPGNNYETQITQLFEVKQKFPNQLLPFVCVDPRKTYPFGVRTYLEEKFLRYGFVGIKLYPALGFYPFDPELEAVYRFACEKKLPVMVHCTKGGVWFQGKIGPEHVLPENFNPEPVNKYNYHNQIKDRNRKFKNNFSNPKNYEEVLKVFPNLKLCFGHFGGSGEIKISQKHGSDTKETNFYLKIKDLMERYDNVYADISYTLSEIKKIEATLLADLTHVKYKERIMFGTDFYMTIQENSEKKLVDNLLKCISSDDFHQIAAANSRKYLESDYYKPN